MDTIRAVLYVIGIIVIGVGAGMMLMGVPRAGGVALLGADIALLAFALPAITAT